MEYILRTKTGQEYRVPEDMIPRVAEAMISGGTANRIEPKKNFLLRAKDAVSTAALSPNVRNAARQFFPFTTVRGR